MRSIGYEGSTEMWKQMWKQALHFTLDDKKDSPLSRYKDEMVEVMLRKKILI
jgi:hypothetical protein